MSLQKILLGPICQGFIILLFLLVSNGNALEVHVQKYDVPGFSMVQDTANLVYLEQCKRSGLKRYEWSAWEGYHELRVRLEPVAMITVKRSSADIITDLTYFINEAVLSSRELGGDILCAIQYRQSKSALGIESMVFRSYHQIVESGNKALEEYYQKRALTNPPITLQDHWNEFERETK